MPNSSEITNILPFEKIFFEQQDNFIYETNDSEDIPFDVISESVKKWLKQYHHKGFCLCQKCQFIDKLLGDI